MTVIGSAEWLLVQIRAEFVQRTWQSMASDPVCSKQVLLDVGQLHVWLTDL